MVNNKEEELTPQQKKAVALHASRDVNGLTYEQIAEGVGVSVTTLTSWRRKNAYRKLLNETADAIADSYLTDAYKAIADTLNNPNSYNRDKLVASKMILNLHGKDQKTIEVVDNKQDKMAELLKRMDNL